MGSIVVVFGFSFLEFSSEIPFMFEMPSLIELLRVGFMASLDLTVHLGAARGYVFVGNAEVGKMPVELWSERRAVIGLNFLNAKGNALGFPIGSRWRSWCCREDFCKLRGIDRRDHVAINDLQFSAGGLVRDCCYLSFDNFAAVKADPDAGAYAVVHIVSISVQRAGYLTYWRIK